MAGAYGELNSRADFLSMLNGALREGSGFLAKDPGDDTIVSILRQLEALTTWTANGREPTRAERRSVDFGLRASREFDDDREKYRWTRSLYALHNYFSDWPSDEKAASATDDDFFDSDEDDGEGDE